MKKYFTYIIEIIVGFAFLQLVNFIFLKNDPGLLKVSPHPYWIIILALAMYYGTSVGLAAGIISAILYLYFSTGLNPMLMSMDNMVLPFLFIVVSLIIGEIRDITRREVVKLKTNNVTLKEEINNLTNRNIVLERINEEWERQIVQSTLSISSLYQISRIIESTPVENIPFTLLNIIHQYIEIKEAAFFEIADNRLITKETLSCNLSADISIDSSSLFKKAMEHKNTVTTLDQHEESGPIIVTPFLIEDKARYLLVVYNLPLPKLTAENMNFLNILAEWVSKRLKEN